jgi:hypothetical protein
MDVNEHERLSNITLRQNSNKEKALFYCCSAFYSNSKVFKMSKTPILKWVWNDP